MRQYAQLVWPGDEQPGDLFFERGTSIAAAVIRFAQLTAHNHVGILIQPYKGEQWWVAEADGVGFRMKTRTIPGGYVVRLPGGHGSEVVHAARNLAGRNTKYDWLAIVWQAGRFFEKWLITAYIGKLLKKVVRPDVETKSRLICSEAALLCLREVGEWDDLLSRFDDYIGFEVSPTDLFRALVPHRDG